MPRINKILFAIFAVVALCSFVLALSYSKSKNLDDSQKIKVSASFFPLADFVTNIGRNKINLKVVVPPGVEPHEFELSPRDLAEILSSDLIIYNGVGLEPWVNSILLNKNIDSIYLDASQTLNLLDLTSEGKRNYDPHVWLDPINAINIAKRIGIELRKIDPENSKYYLENELAFTDKLALLDEAYKTGLKSCTRRMIVSSHDAFGYLARRYNFDVIAISGLSPSDEPTIKELSIIVDKIKSLGIPYVFTETLISPKTAEVLAAEAGVKTLTINPIEGVSPEEQMIGMDYISIAYENLANLRKSMECI